MSVPADLRCSFMHFMPYVYLPEDEAQYTSLWVDFPNRVYDPERAQGLYRRYLDELILADRLGYDGVVVNEHHSTAYSMMPACSLIAAILARETARARICVFGTPINLEYPNRLAEEYAMLDVLSGGRLEIAIPAGTGMEYWANATLLNPATARQRMREAVDVLLQSWTVDGPTTFAGDFYAYRYLNVWPRPVQRPHPPIYMVSTGSPDTLNLAAEKGFGYSSVFVPIPAQLKSFDEYRSKLVAHGHTPTPDKITFGVIAYVAESDEQAEREGKPHILKFFNTFLRTTPRYLTPPGFVSPERLRERLASPDGHGAGDWESLNQLFRIVVGSADTVASRIATWLDEAQSSRLLCNLHVADMPHWKTVKNLTLFAEEVLPRLRRASGQTSAASVNGAAVAGVRP